MARDVRFIVYSSQESSAAELRKLLIGTGRIKIVAEVDEPALLPHALKQFPVDVVLVDLDPNPDVVLSSLGELSRTNTHTTIVATSEVTDGQLILKTMRLGVREFLPKPIDIDALTEAMEKITAEQGDQTKLGKLISVVGAAGGVGASVLAINLAVELATRCEGSVTIVDLDYRFGQVATLLDVEPTYTLADLCQTPEELEPQVIERALVKHSSGLQVLSRPASLAQADTITAASCVGLLTNLLQLNDFVILDGPVRSDVSSKPVLDIADVAILVVQLLVPTVRNAARILDGLREGSYPMDRVKLVCNRIGRESTALSVSDVSETLSLPVAATIPDDWATVSGAINLGETLLCHGPKSKVRQSIEEIARRLHSPVSDADEKETPKKGLIGRIFANA